MSKWQKGMKSPNPNGRPKGSKTKVSVKEEIAKAFARGTSFTDIIMLIEDKIARADELGLSEDKQFRYIKELITFKIKLAEMDMKSDREASKERQQVTRAQVRREQEEAKAAEKSAKEQAPADNLFKFQRNS